MPSSRGGTEQSVRYCDRCEAEQGKGIVDVGDIACSACGAHDAPHVYVPADDEAVRRATDAFTLVIAIPSRADAERAMTAALAAAGGPR